MCVGMNADQTLAWAHADDVQQSGLNGAPHGLLADLVFDRDVMHRLQAWRFRGQDLRGILYRDIVIWLL